MRYITVAVWAVLISSALSYVLTSMSGDPFNFIHALIFAGFLMVIIIFIGDGVLKGNEEK